MTRLGLTLNEAKTSLRNAQEECFDFLGYLFGPHRYKANGQQYLSASPSRKSMQGLKRRSPICWCPPTPIHGRNCATS
jgi:RNA-directed DNA polymerase